MGTLRGFSLIEVLAAVMLMGLLVTAVIPLHQRLVARQRLISDALSASQVLAERLRQKDPLVSGDRAIPDHADWELRIDELQPDQPAMVTAVPRRWFRLVVRRRSDSVVIATSWAVSP